MTKYRNGVLTCKKIVRKESGYQWDLGKPEDVASDDFWAFFKTGGLEHGGYEISAKEG